eukprot:TRINITY_DN15149_c0_g1::TRINITY_DN15149_c0_g1_i1::g.30604::m.30604 TRINITY_DN15149_c0_g1::TRINITY_DN15149_c0_g1_i1::g.30604  ORF type:complete len:217 (+),score=19.82,sp/Q9UST8/RNH1_SCHPO/42.31/1e-08,Cauli_VI/PF01693.11/4.1e-17 TRINITY_DN15149_c0_g1_i1:108-758(+)
MGKKGFYAVSVGRNPGIYESWNDASKQVNSFSGATHQRFNTLEEAKEFMKSGGTPIDVSFEKMTLNPVLVPMTLFFSRQSNKADRNEKLERCLSKACDELGLEFVLRTSDELGARQIEQTVLPSIRGCTVFVADICSASDHSTRLQNVIFELGVAFAVLPAPATQIILLAEDNTEANKSTKSTWPFDLEGFCIKDEWQDEKLVAELTERIRLCIPK